MSNPVTLRGITWGHDRGYLPLAATAARFADDHPGVRIAWERRSLREFEEYPVERLAPEFDLIVLDHPFVGHAGKKALVLPLDEHLPAAYLDEQAAGSVGASHASYAFAGHQWALGIDAAAPVACWREDLLAAAGRRPPATWDELLALAREGRVEVPAAPINCLMNFYMLCAAEGEEPFQGRDQVVGREAGLAALARLRELLAACDPGIWVRNPIGSLELLARSDRGPAAYCPFAYGYSNYARDGYGPHRLTFGDLPSRDGRPLRSILGGTGLAVSALRPNPATSLAYAAYVAAPATQRTLYTAAGGQPGLKEAWTDPQNNRLAHGYFLATLPALERACLRPRYYGHVEFQRAAGPVIHAALRRVEPDEAALARVDELYRHSLRHARVFA